MIPRHAPPFGVRELLGLAARTDPVSVEALESACVEILGVRDAVLLPSARAGILWTLKAVLEPFGVVVGPAYICDVVHDAMILSGAPMQFVDTAPDDYLMDISRLPTARSPQVLIVSDIYGLCGDTETLKAYRRGLATPCIWDMAMSIPRRADLLRLQATDVAVVSFGLAKCLYSGWGGVLLSNNLEVTGHIRRLRDAAAVKETSSLRLRHGLSLFGRTLAHSRGLYACGRVVADWRAPRLRRARKKAAAQPSVAAGNAAPSREWTELMTSLNRKVALCNLRNASEHLALRTMQAERYFDGLEPLGVVRGVSRTSLPQSHFPIRVAARAREPLRRKLCERGIDTGTLFPLSDILRREDYPQAARTADEVIVLPMGDGIRLDEVDMVVAHVAKALASLSARALPPD